MRILYLDTTSSFLYACIYEDGKIVDAIVEKLNTELSQKALPLIVNMFEKNNIDPFDINKIILVNGPGSFTGIRIGVTIAKVYAWSKNIAITTISSLEAMALSSKIDAEYVVPIIDARHEHVYGAIYNKNNEKVMNDQYIPLNALLVATDNLPGIISFITNDNLNIKDKEEYIPNFLKIIESTKDKANINAHEIDANYLKKTQAEEERI